MLDALILGGGGILIRAQHLGGRDRFRPSSFGTTVAVLQTPAAALQWPFTSEVAAELEGAMQLPHGVPTLEQWEKRGAAKGGSAKNEGAPTVAVPGAGPGAARGEGGKEKGGKGGKGKGKGKGGW